MHLTLHRLPPQMRNYTAAATVYLTLSQQHIIEEGEVTPVTEEELQLQALENSTMYLTIPSAVLERGILLVNSLSTLQEAADEFGLTLMTPVPPRAQTSMRPAPSGTINKLDYASKSSSIDPAAVAAGAGAGASQLPPIRLWVGLDAEWKAYTDQWQGDPEEDCKHPSGAAILQVQCRAVWCSRVS